MNFPRKPQGLSDDIESFAHVIFWHATKFHRHDLSGMDPTSRKQLAQHVRNMYFDCHIGEDGHRGCRQKLMAMRAGNLNGIELDPNNIAKPFLELIENLLSLCREHYKLVKYEDLRPAAHTTIRPPELLDPNELIEESLSVPAESDYDSSDGHSDLSSRSPSQTVAGEKLSEYRGPTDALEDVAEGTAAAGKSIEGPLRDHAGIMKIFSDAVRIREGWSRDKIWNQFNDLPDDDEVNRITSTATSSIKKRCSSTPSHRSGKRVRLTAMQSRDGSSSDVGHSDMVQQSISSNSLTGLF